MTPTKLLLGQMLIVALIVVAAVWFATQWAAAALAYQPELGAPWFKLGGVPVYAPWALFPWWFHFNAYAPAVFDEAGAIAAGSGLLGCGAAIFGSDKMTYPPGCFRSSVAGSQSRWCDVTRTCRSSIWRPMPTS